MSGEVLGMPVKPKALEVILRLVGITGAWISLIMAVYCAWAFAISLATVSTTSQAKAASLTSLSWLRSLSVWQASLGLVRSSSLVLAESWPLSMSLLPILLDFICWRLMILKELSLVMQSCKVLSNHQSSNSSYNVVHPTVPGSSLWKINSFLWGSWSHRKSGYFPLDLR